MAGPQMLRVARFMVEAWTNPENFPSGRDLMVAIIEGMDELTLAAGRELPDMTGVWSGSETSHPGERLRGALRVVAGA